MSVQSQVGGAQGTCLCDVEPREIFFEDVSLNEKIEEIAAAHVLQYL